MNAAQREQILKLPVEERRSLAEEIWKSIRSNPDQLPLTEEQRKELDRRLETHEADPESAKDFETVNGRKIDQMLDEMDEEAGPLPQELINEVRDEWHAG